MATHRARSSFCTNMRVVFQTARSPRNGRWSSSRRSAGSVASPRRGRKPPGSFARLQSPRRPRPFAARAADRGSVRGSDHFTVTDRPCAGNCGDRLGHSTERHLVNRSASLLLSLLATLGAVAAACGGGVVPIAENGADAGGDGHTSSGCSGTTPNCFGSDLHSCCGQDPSGLATCMGNEWMCGGAGAPGCNGRTCGTVEADASTTCIGDAPNCFGSNLAGCCGQDPAGHAECVGGTWTCGSAAAPGCNGESCTAPRDASSGDASSGGCGDPPPLHCLCAGDQASCIDGTWQCPSACDDAGTGGSCPAGAVLVVTTSCSGSGACLSNDGGAQCSGGSVKVGECCCQSAACQPIPGSCDGTASCGCASSLCPSDYQCGINPSGMPPAGALLCGFYPP
jgi:hypothetical protein